MIVNAANKQFGDNLGPYYRQVVAERIRRAAAGLNDNDYAILTDDGRIIRPPKVTVAKPKQSTEIAKQSPIRNKRGNTPTKRNGEPCAESDNPPKS